MSYPVTEVHTHLAASPDAYDVDKLIQFFTIGRVRVSTRQMVSSSIGIDKGYLRDVLIPSILKRPLMDQYPCIGFPDNVSQLPPNLNQEVVDLPFACSLHVVDGAHRVEALKAIEVSLRRSISWIFVIVHPAILSVGLHPYLLLQQVHLKHELNHWNRHPVAVLNLATLAAHDLYTRNREDLISPMISSLVHPEEVHSCADDGSTIVEGTMLDLFSAILSSPCIVAAVVESKILEEHLWRDAKEDAILFLYFLARYGVSQTAVKIIRCAAEICQSLSRELHRPFLLSDILPPGVKVGVLGYAARDTLLGIYRSVGLLNSIKLQDFWHNVRQLSRKHNLPELFFSPWALQPRSSSMCPLDQYLSEMQEVLKGAVFLRLGHEQWRELGAPWSISTFPSNPKADLWTILEGHFIAVGNYSGYQKFGKLIQLLKPGLVSTLAYAWRKYIIEEAKKAAELDGRPNSQELSIDNAFSRWLLSSRVPRLLSQSREWLHLGAHLGLVIGQKLRCSQDGYPPVLFSADNSEPPCVRPPIEDAPLCTPVPMPLAPLPCAHDIISVDALRAHGIPSTALLTIVDAYLQLPTSVQDALTFLECSEMLHAAIWAMAPFTSANDFGS